ncbi:16787_t:CDS:1 [Acaulospora colombiana]|uniref:16787_t:CDS:1 n=1 Tax=Acaulospora colombiana TaxID=27376 RepID=A0ACA9MVI6_9GLOM|nr:16787_t:CDS:1 [Acaulospora colombiana]
MGSLKYNYSVEYTGVGRLKDSDPAVGFATQIAIFRDLQPETKPSVTNFGSYEHLERIVFPFYDEPEKSVPEILDVIHYYMQYICNPVVQLSGIKPNHVKTDDLWGIHKIRQLCKSRDRLREVIGTSAEFTLLNEDEIIAHREYKLDTPDEDEYESCANGTLGDDSGWPTNEFDDDSGYPTNKFDDDSGWPTEELGDNPGWTTKEFDDNSGWATKKFDNDSGWPTNKFDGNEIYHDGWCNEG